MTRRARWTRPLAALFALWFAFVVGDPGLLHSCPMHGGHAMASASAGVEHAATTQTGHAAMGHAMSHEAAPHQATSHDASHHGSSGQCTCMGQCCVATAVAPLPAVAALHVPAAIALAEPAQRVAFVVAPAAPDTRLPFANGPPTA
jgi:hypothetical protein